MKLWVSLFLGVLWTQSLWALSANQVWFEFYPFFYRVRISYTVPALRELRYAYADFHQFKKANKMYFQLLRGAEFFLDDAGKIAFRQPKKLLTPW